MIFATVSTKQNETKPDWFITIMVDKPTGWYIMVILPIFLILFSVNVPIR